MWTWILGISVTFPLLSYVYIKHNDKRLGSLPPEALSFSPKRFTPEDARSAGKQFAEKPVSVEEQLPPSTGRRYIVVGGVCDRNHVCLVLTDQNDRQALSADGSCFNCCSAAKTLEKFVSSIFDPLRALTLFQEHKMLTS